MPRENPRAHSSFSAALGSRVTYEDGDLFAVAAPRTFLAVRDEVQVTRVLGRSTTG